MVHVTAGNECICALSPRTRGKVSTDAMQRGSQGISAAEISHLLNRSDVTLQARELLPRQTFVLSARARVNFTDHHTYGAYPQEVTQLELV